MRERLAGEVFEGLLERERLALAHVLVVVSEQQPPAAVAVLAQHVELDHVHALAQRRVEARERVTGSHRSAPL